MTVLHVSEVQNFCQNVTRVTWNYPEAVSQKPYGAWIYFFASVRFGRGTTLPPSFMKIRGGHHGRLALVDLTWNDPMWKSCSVKKLLLFFFFLGGVKNWRWKMYSRRGSRRGDGVQTILGRYWTAFKIRKKSWSSTGWPSLIFWSSVRNLSHPYFCKNVTSVGQKWLD